MNPIPKFEKLNPSSLISSSIRAAMTPTVFKQDQLQHLPQADRQLFTHFGLGEAVDQPFECIHHAFEHHARQHPYTYAVEDFEQKISYSSLNRQANCLATHLRAKGIGAGSRVCLLVERNILLVVGILAILKAGAAYVPLDGNVVADKTLNHALKDSGSSLVVVLRKFVHRVGETSAMVLEDTICDDPYSLHCQKPQDSATRTDSCYIIYTSGTTGVPKGVDVLHKNVTNLVCMEPGNLKMKHEVRVSQLMNISFDMAQWEILGSMANGATLCLRGKTSKEWRAVMRTVDVVVATPSMLAPHKPEDYPNIKVIAVAGEPCPKALADTWAKQCAFYNCCGPTEITIVNTMHLHKSGKVLGIGGPTPNNTVYVLDEKAQPVPIGQMGVMWAGGAGITRGYLNLPDKTSEKYKRDPFLDDGSMMFNTGDLGRWLPDGDLEHLGRVDHQVKVKGFRVELDGVAAAMETTPGVKVATAILIKGELWGFFAPANVKVDDVMAATARVQPHYAVPTKYVALGTFPETSNGKSDKRALEKIALESGGGGAVVPAKRAFKQELLKDLPATDKELFTKYGLGEAIKPAFECVHQAFEHHARNHPDTIAVEDFGQKITFAELDRQSNCLATRLRESGVAPGSRVCLLVERSILMVVGIMSVLKAGGAYVPLDGNVVADKTLNHALKDSGSSLVLVQRKFTHRIGEMPIVCLEDSICESPTNPHCQRPKDLAKTTDSAYIIYTSGTTGVPKGVDVMHKNVTNLVCMAPGNLKMGHGVRVSQLMNISFDMAAWEILGSMCNGSTLCLRGKTSKEWRAVMKTVEVVVATPSMLAPHKPEDYPNIKVVAVAGEPCPKALADNWAKTVSFYNCCGPTEITIVNTMHLHSPGIDLGIGGPTPNNTVYVLDANLKPVKIGEMGVMWAGGNGITRGYLNLPDKTSEKYQLDPFLDDGSFMFNTGDLGRWLPNGDLEHLGRVDHQVKVKGFRVELDGVAAAMETTPGVKVATAILIDSELWGFFAPSNVSVDDVKAATSKVQPHYAVPTKFLSVDKFPETANGKSDKRALEQLARDSLKAPVAAAPIPTPAPVVVQAVPQVTEAPIIEKTELQMTEKPAVEKLISSNASIITNNSDNTLRSPTPVPGAHPMQAPSLNNTLVSIPLEKKIDLPALEGQTSIWAGYEQDVLPDKTESRVVRNLRHQIFYLYRRLFGIVFLTNLGLFIWYAAKGANSKQIGEVVVGNIFGAILMRQDYVIDAFFVTFTSIPNTWPLWIRRIAARVYHIGGLHSGAGASGALWLILFCGQATREVVMGTGASGATLAITYIVLALLLMILVFAHPTMRRKFHDSFETTHRFLGWSATGLVWIQIILLTNDYRGSVPLMTALLHSAPWWLIVVATLSLILPWLRLKKVPVRCEKLSNHAVRMYFDYATPGSGSFVRLSDSPLTEWHGFATMPEPGKRGFSLVVSRAGDWTNKMISKPPTHIWKRGVPTYGVMKIAPMFRRLVVVATGSGIGPCTAAILEQKIPIRVLWTAPNVRETFGDKLVDSILEANPDSVIYNTRQHGKPDMVKLTYRLVKEFNAEAVVIISNQTLTEKVVYGMMSRGIPAFGAIWDSSQSQYLFWPFCSFKILVEANVPEIGRRSGPGLNNFDCNRIASVQNFFNEMISKRLILLLWITSIHLAGIYLFTRGFLLTRLSLPDYTTCSDQKCTLKPTHKRAVVLIIDALRFDFVTPNPPVPSSPHHHNILTLPRELTESRPKHSYLFNAYADPPTTTLQRIKGLTTGSLPTFVDIGNNFGGSSIAEDSILKQLRLAGKKTAFMGDDTWMSVFPDVFEPNMTFPYDSFNVEDLHTVDEGVIEHLFPLLEDPTKPFDFLVGHFLGVDHVGHRVGPDHPSMKAKLNQMNDVLTHVVDLLDDDTLLVVLGDHGMDRAGDHGGDGVLETSSALWVYSKGPVISQAHIPPPSGLLRYTVFPGTTVRHRNIQQIDILPTLSLLLGLPIPYNNLGTVIPELFWRDRKGTELLRALDINTAQIKTYLDTYRSSPSGGELDESWKGIEAAWAATRVISPLQDANFIKYSNFNWVALAACRSMWAQFNPLLMGVGLAVLGIGLLATWAVWSGLSAAQNKWDDWLGLHLAHCLRGLAGGAVVGVIFSLLFASYLPGIDALDCIIFFAPLISSLVVIVASPPNMSFQAPHSIPVLLILHTLAFFSNSFTFWEDRLVPFLLVTSIVPSALTGFSAPTARLRYRILGFSLLFAACVRLMAISTVCREEQQPYCHVTFYASSSPPLLALLLSIPAALGLPYALARFMRISRSDVGVARSFIPLILRPSLVAGAAFWIIEWADSAGVLGQEWESLLRVARTATARLAFGVAVMGGGFLWWAVPICLDFEAKEAKPGQKRQVNVIGYANAFGSPYLIFWSIALGLVYAATQLTGQIVLGLTTVALLSWLEVVDSVRDVRSIEAQFSNATPSALLNADASATTSPPIRFTDTVPLALLGIHVFFSTGHQSTISSIQWKSAYLLTPTLAYPWAVVTVVLNSVGPMFLMSLAVPLLALWNRAPVPNITPPSQKTSGDAQVDQPVAPDVQVKGESTLAAVGYMGYYAMLLLGTAVSAAILRRHLMVWKVFAPRFMAGVLGVLVADAGVVLGVGIGVERITYRVGRMFGKTE
ncbi:hypothetical protein DXG01_011672 [Tephrocybe rancida]|nr:hypothetical protein DXG01_011672 [Tephrocybe rancida]